ncbi:MAG: hypothetical protein SV686_16195 [Thermodesulfobacteriota bacterium]|nr:hypothetical protein [Thermodesulfobacteriota bacterium]
MNRTRAFCISALLTLAMVMAAPSSSRGYDDASIPEDLRQWKTWVLYGQESQFCPSPYNDGTAHQCVWPSQLQLELDEKGGRFAQKWLLFIRSPVPLPGGGGLWPINVTRDGVAVPVVGGSGTPEVFLEPGKHQLEGEFQWKSMPEMIHIPPASGLVGLTIGGIPVDFPLWDSQGRLWLQKGKKELGGEDRLEVLVYRLLKDTIPMEVANRIDLSISGRAREITIKGLLLDGSVPMAVKSPLPTRLGQEGELLIQTRPGQWGVEIETRMIGPVSKIGPIKAEFGQEIWCFEARNHLRMVKLEGVPPVDPKQTNIPDHWKRFPAFVVNPGARITFSEIRRGDPNPAPDRIHLNRTFWLDFDGAGLTTRDRITGVMSRQWYLAMNPPNLLGHVQVDGVDQLITEQGINGQKKAGVELRKGKLDLIAESRLEGPHRLIPAVGWDHDFESLSARLNLPPGWRLLTASGVDVIPGTWFEQWTLLDLFLILIIGMAVWRLHGWVWGLLAFVTLGLIYHEAGSPRMVWLNLLAASALLRFLPAGWFRKAISIWFLVSIVTLIATAIPFMVHQVRLGIYPQLEQPPLSAGPYQAMRADTDKAQSPSLKRKRVPLGPGVVGESDAKLYSRTLSSSRKISAPKEQAVFTQDPNALIQTGPGIPSWKWRSISMRWNGPVDRNHPIHLRLLSPFVNLILAFLRVFLLGFLILGLVDFRRWKTQINGSLLMVLLVPLWVFPRVVMAEVSPQGLYPPSSILQELKERLLEPADCLPECADSPWMALTIRSDVVSILLEVHTAADTAVPLPGNSKSWLPEKVLLDDQPAEGLLRDKSGVLWGYMPAGIHMVSLIGKAQAEKAFQIPLPLKPRRATVESVDWEVQGVGPGGEVEASLLLTPQKVKGHDKPFQTPLAFLPFVHVKRVLSLGLTWQVHTTVTRLTPPGTPILLSVPLIKGESVTTAGIRVDNRMALINMGPKTRKALWASSLKTDQSIRLEAPTSVPWTETWILDASPIWHCETSGIPVIHHQNQQGYWRPEWRPWPGEGVLIQVSRPQAIDGQFVTIDGSDLVWTPGERFTRAGLIVKIRTSRGGQYKIKLPRGIKLQSVKRNSKSQPIGDQTSEVLVALQPGSQKVEIDWHQDEEASMLTKGPEVDIGANAVNAGVTFHMPRGRWVLWAGGPRLGPAVLFWSYLIVVLLVSIALGKIPWTPLKTYHWLLIGLGLTQVHPLTAIMIGGWLLALGLRKKYPLPNGRFSFDMVQIVLVLWTIAALIGLYMAVKTGLLGIPDMQVAGNGSSDFRLHWTQDRISGLMPQPWVFSLPMFVYRILMLFWALWLAYSLLKWLGWGWQCFNEGGTWRKIIRRKIKKEKDPVEFEVT